MRSGIIDDFRNGRVFGWAFDDSSDEPVSLDVYLDNKKIARIIADEVRRDLRASGFHRDGAVAFSYRFDQSDEAYINAVKLEVKFSSNDQPLRKSPIHLDVQNIRLDGERIWVLGLPKSGTSALLYKIADAYDKKVVYFEPGGNKSITDFVLHRDLVINQIEPVIVKSLYRKYNNEVIDLIQGLYNKKVFIIRDPRDTIISHFFYIWYKPHGLSKDKFDQAYSLITAKEENPQSIAMRSILPYALDIEDFLDDFYSGYLNVLNRYKGRDDCFTIRYENFVDNKLAKLEDFLGVNLINDTAVPKRLKRVVRTKSYGEWRKYFTPEDVSYFKPLLNPYLEQLGYSTSDWNLIRVDGLDPDVGSTYMKSLFYGKI